MKILEKMQPSVTVHLFQLIEASKKSISTALDKNNQQYLKEDVYSMSSKS